MKEKNSKLAGPRGTVSRKELVDRLADSLQAPLSVGTARHLAERMSFPGKATAIIGVCGAGRSCSLSHPNRS
jgi:predicted ATPase